MNKPPIADKIDSLIRFFLYILIFWLPYSPAVIESCVVVSSVLWTAKRMLLFDRRIIIGRPIRNKVKSFLLIFKPQPSFLNIPIALFIFACLLSSSSSAFIGQSFRGFMTKTFEWFIIYFLIIESVTKKKHIQWILGIFLFTAISSCLDGIVQHHITQYDIFSGQRIARGSGATAGFKTYNDFGGFLTIVTPLTFFLTFTPRRSYIHQLWIIIFFLAVWTSIITFSRGTWVGILGGVLITLFIRKKRWFFILMGIIFLLLLCYYSLLSTSLAETSRVSLENIYSSGQGRLGIWLDSLKLIGERPFFGHGLNTYMMLFQEYRQTKFEPTYAHNCYIQMVAEIGIIGLLCFFWIIVKLFQEIRAIVVESSKSSPFESQMFLAVGLLAGIAAFLIHSFFDTNLYSLQLSTLFWFMIGYLVAVVQVLNR